MYIYILYIYMYLFIYLFIYYIYLSLSAGHMASTMFGLFGHVDRKFTRFPVMTVHFFAIFSNPRAASCRAGGGLQFIK